MISKKLDLIFTIQITCISVIITAKKIPHKVKIINPS